MGLNVLQIYPAICGNALYLSVQQPILLAQPADRAPVNAVVVSPAEPPTDREERRQRSGDSGGGGVGGALWLERGGQTSSIELHVLYDDTISVHSTPNYPSRYKDQPPRRTLINCNRNTATPRKNIKQRS